MNAVSLRQRATGAGGTDWRRSVMLLAALLVLTVLIYRSTAANMLRVWANSETYAHAYLVIPMVGWLVWRLRSNLSQLSPRPEPVALLFMAVATLPWLAGALVGVHAAMQFALVTQLILCVWLVCGREVFSALLFPLGFLYFCVPVGEFLLPYLMEATADFTIGALRLTGVPVYREGLQFIIPSGSWSVVEACSGVRYLIASVMVGTLFAYLNFRSISRRLVFVAFSVAVPVVANWVRAYIIVMLGHLSNNKIATGVDHLVYGWVFFGLVITIMFTVGARWSDLPSGESTQDTPPANPDAAATRPANGRLLAAALAALLIQALPWGVMSNVESRLAQLGEVRLDVPQPTSPWRLTDRQIDWVPFFNGASAQWSGVFERDGQAVAVHLYYYRRQLTGAQVAGSLNALVQAEQPVSRWNLLPGGQAVVASGGQDTTWKAHEMASTDKFSSNVRRMTVWQTYWTDDHFTASGIETKVRTALELAQGDNDDGAAIVLHVDRAEADGGRALLTDFVAQQLPALRAVLQRAHASH